MRKVSIHQREIRTTLNDPLLANGLKSFKATFDRTTMILRFLSTNGLRFFLQIWYAKRPIFWIPKGLVPVYIEWLLAFPRAPTGSVSIQVWGIACATVVQLVSAAVVAAFVIVQSPNGKTQQEGIKMGTGGSAKQEKEL